MRSLVINSGRIIGLCVLIATTVLTAGCSRDSSDLELYIAEVRSRTSRAVEPIPQIKRYEAFVYREQDRRDPFVKIEPDRSSIQGPGGPGVRPDLNRNREPLEEFPLDSLRMLGVIAAGGKTFALIKAPDSVIHRVKPSNHMGQNYGVINSVSESEINLTEIIPDGFGGWMQRPAVVVLSDK